MAYPAIGITKEDDNVVFSFLRRQFFSDVNKANSVKAKAKAKARQYKAKAKAKASHFKG